MTEPNSEYPHVEKIVCKTCKLKQKTLHNSDIPGAKKNVPDIKVVGDGDLFKLIAKTYSEKEGWMKSTKAMEIPAIGCVVQVTTQQQNPDGSYAVAEAVTFVPGTQIVKTASGHHIIKAHLY